MSDVRNLYYYGQPTREQVALTKRAKEMLNPPFLVLPTPYTDDTEDVPLAFTWPDHPILQGFADVRAVDTPERMVVALRAIWENDPESRLTTPEKWFRRLGWEVREIHE